MSKIEDKLKDMGLKLPEAFVYPNKNRQGCVQVGNIVFMSGHGGEGVDMPGLIERGKVGLELSERDGYIFARATALSMLATLKKHCGDLDRVKRVIRLFGMVNAVPHFERQPFVIDGASDLLFELFGPEYGCHARSAIGMAELPRRVPVEINGEFELWPE